jgi:arylsulfatase A-like enzyme
MNRNVIAAVAGVVLVAVAVAGVVISRQPPKQPNVLIILWDTTRADRLSMYGYSLETTPRMAKWAEKHGVIFEKAISPDMWTVPSHASLFTGLDPGTHGAGFDHRWLDAKNVTLAEWFGEHGWDTYAFSANPNLSPSRVNLLQGFENIETSWRKPWADDVKALLKKKLIKSDRSTEISPGAKKKGGTGFYNAGPIAHLALTNWLDTREEKDKPFLVYLSYMEAHKPRVPYLDSRKKLTDPPVIELGLQTDLSLNNQLLYSYDKLSYTPAELEAINRVYDATLVDLDNATADLLEDLDARGILDDTIIVFTADHGEQLGEHQQFGHRSGVYQQLLHVPLVIAYPRKLNPRRVSVPVTNLQVFDTLLTLAGLESPQTGHAQGDLTVVKDALVGVFSETLSIDKEGFGKIRKMYPDIGRDVWANTYQSVVHGNWKLIESINFDSHELVDCELYDLETDPDELTNKFTEVPEKSRELMDKLDAWKSQQVKWNAGKADEVVENLSDKEKQQLELLGYIESSGDEPAPDAAADAQLPPSAGNRCRLP